MKLFVSLSLLLLLVGSFVWRDSVSDEKTEEIQWLTWEEAIAKNDKAPRKLLVDVYTDWCGWCKKMDKETFTDPGVVAFINANFYAIKLDAEQKNVIKYRDNSFSFNPEFGRRGAHELAASLLDGKMGYPSLVYLDETQNRISISPGYKVVEGLMLELEYVAQNHYKTSTFEEFRAGK
jgi:thioredoxin-related protein